MNGAKILSGYITSAYGWMVSKGTREEIEANGGRYHPGPSGTPPANAEHKFRDPNGIVFDISTHGWDGAKR